MASDCASTVSAAGVAGVVLAAGASTRFAGRPKVLLPLGERTIVETVIATAKRACLDPLIVVARENDDALVRRLAASVPGPDYVVVNRRPAEGIGGSVRAGVVAASSAGANAVAILLGDEPGLKAEWIRRVVEEWGRDPSAVARADYSDRPGHPVVVPRSVFGRVGETAPSGRVLTELRKAGIAVRLVPIPERAPLDVDTARDYEELVGRYEETVRRSLPARPVLDGTSPVAAGPRESQRR